MHTQTGPPKETNLQIHETGKSMCWLTCGRGFGGRGFGGRRCSFFLSRNACLSIGEVEKLHLVCAGGSTEFGLQFSFGILLAQE